MKIYLTDDFKNNTILAEKGIRCVLRGFALVNDSKHWLQKLHGVNKTSGNLYEFESITLEELQEHTTLVLDEDKNDPDILNNLFDITYEPCLELSTPDQMECKACGGSGKDASGNPCPICDGDGWVYHQNEKGTVLGGEKFGTYKIRINSMRNNKTEKGIQGTYQAIVLIGEKYTEDTVHVISKHKSYIGIIVYFDGSGLDGGDMDEYAGVTETINGLTIGPNTAFTLNIQFSLSQLHMIDDEDGPVLDTEYALIMQHSSQKDQTTTQLNLPGAFLVPSGKEYSARVDLEAGRNIAHTGIAYMDKTFNLIPDTYKNNNIFNVTPRFNIFDEHNDKFVKPQTLVSYGGMVKTSAGNFFENQHIAIEYDPSYFSMNEKAPTGNSRFDLFGGATKKENSGYDDSRMVNTTGYLRLVSDRGYHFSGENLVEVLSNANSAGVYDGALYVSDNNRIGGETDGAKTFDLHTIDTEGITAAGISGGMFIDSNRSTFNGLSGLTAIGTHKASADNSITIPNASGMLPCPNCSADHASRVIVYVIKNESSSYQTIWNEGNFSLSLNDSTKIFTTKEAGEDWLEEMIDDTFLSEQVRKSLKTCSVEEKVVKTQLESFYYMGKIESDNTVKFLEDDGTFTNTPSVSSIKRFDSMEDVDAYRVNLGLPKSQVRPYHAYINNNIYEVCPKCHEAGEYIQQLPDYYSNPYYCKTCSGTGKIDLSACPVCGGDGNVGSYSYPGRLMMYGLNTSSFDYKGFNNTFIGHKGLLSNYGHDAVIFGNHNACGNREYDMCIPCSGTGRLLCNTCSGSGKVDGQAMQECTACVGFGFVTYSGDPCGLCSGTGKLSDGSVCYMCGGTVYYDYPGLEFSSCSAFISGYDAIYDCPVCKTKKEIPIPNKTVPVDCPECEGIGRSKCKACNGEGFIEGYVHAMTTSACPTCNDKLKICTKCKGKGYTDRTVCPTCSGTGEALDGKCPTCKGVGYIHIVTCTLCGGDKMICDKCEGTGITDCDVCGGDSILECPECNTPSDVKCTFCNGAGVVTDADKIREYVGKHEAENYLGFAVHTPVDGATCHYCGGTGLEAKFGIYQYIPYGDRNDLEPNVDFYNIHEGNETRYVPVRVTAELKDGGNYADENDWDWVFKPFIACKKNVEVTNTEDIAEPGGGTKTITVTTNYNFFVNPDGFIDIASFSWYSYPDFWYNRPGAGFLSFFSVDELTRYFNNNAEHFIEETYNDATSKYEYAQYELITDVEQFAGSSKYLWAANDLGKSKIFILKLDKCYRAWNRYSEDRTWQHNMLPGTNIANRWQHYNINTDHISHDDSLFTSLRLYDLVDDAEKLKNDFIAAAAAYGVEPQIYVDGLRIEHACSPCKHCYGTKIIDEEYVFGCPCCSNIEGFRNEQTLTSAYDARTGWFVPIQPTVWYPEHHIMFKNFYTPSAEPGHYNPNNYLGKHECDLCDGIGYVSEAQRIAYLGEDYNNRYMRLVDGTEQYLSIKLETSGTPNRINAAQFRNLYIGDEPTFGEHEIWPTSGTSSFCPKCSKLFNELLMGPTFFNADNNDAGGYIINDIYGFDDFKLKNVNESLWRKEEHDDTGAEVKNDEDIVNHIGAGSYCSTCNFNGTPKGLDKRKCTTCNGTGIDNTLPCPTCHGTKSTQTTCSTCNGSGKLTNDCMQCRSTGKYTLWIGTNNSTTNYRYVQRQKNQYSSDICVYYKRISKAATDYVAETHSPMEPLPLVNSLTEDWLTQTWVLVPEATAREALMWGKATLDGHDSSGNVIKDAYEVLLVPAENAETYLADILIITQTTYAPINTQLGPLNIADTLDCADCDGKGYIDWQCYTCHGNGYISQPCEKCHGTGTGDTCIVCNGKGYYDDGEDPRGRIMCPECKDGKTPCNKCDEVKHWYCTTCSGAGEVWFQPTVAYEDGKVVAVGDGYFYKNMMPDQSNFDMYRDYINIHPDNNCDLNVGQYIKKMNLLSVEHNGLLMVHNNNYDEIPDPHVKHYLASDFFAVRGWAKYNELEERFANLQNGCYAPDAIYFTKRTAHNEEWKLRIRELDYLLNDSYIKTNASMLKTAALNQAIYDFNRKNTTFLLRLGPIISYAWKGKKGWKETHYIAIKGAKGGKGKKGLKGTKGKKGFRGLKGVSTWREGYFIAYEGETLGLKGAKGMKGLKGLKGQEQFKDLELHIMGMRYKYYIADILAAIKEEFGRSISNTGNLGKNSETYTIYCLNADPTENLYFKGVRLRKMRDGNYQTLNAVKGIKPAQVQRLVYKDNGYNGEYGIMNFDYAYNNRFLA